MDYCHANRTEGNMPQRKILKTLGGLLVFAACADFVYAQSAPGGTIAFPMVGIGFGQTLQVNVIGHPPNPCTPTIFVYGQGGEVIVAFEEGDPDKPLLLGSTVSSRRLEVRPEVTLVPPAGVSVTACRAQATAEISDHYSKTDWVATAGLVPPGPNVMPIYLGPVGLIFEQTARLNVVAHPPQPCFGVLSFIDPAGNPLGSQSQVNLAAGLATFIDLPGQTIVPISQRREVIGVFTPTATTSPAVCIPSLEVFDQVTGYTRVFIPPGPPVLPSGTTITAP
jgi:hypothetical protein